MTGGGDLDKGHIRSFASLRLTIVLIYNGRGSGLDRFADVGMAVGPMSFHRDEEGSLLYLAGVVANLGYVESKASLDLDCPAVPYYVF